MSPHAESSSNTLRLILIIKEAFMDKWISWGQYHIINVKAVRYFRRQYSNLEWETKAFVRVVFSDADYLDREFDSNKEMEQAYCLLIKELGYE